MDKIHFTAKLRKVGKRSLIITIPIEITESLGLEENQIKEFFIKK